MFLSFIIAVFFLSFLHAGPPLLEMKFYINFSTLGFVLFWSASKLTLANNLFDLNITLQTNAFITSEKESFCYSPPNTVSHCKWTCSLLATNAFCTGDKHIWCWKNMEVFKLKITTLVVEMNALKRVFILQPHTYTQPHYQQLYNRICYVVMIASHSYSSQKKVLSR